LFTIVSYKIFSIYLNNKKVRWGWSAVFSYIISFGFRCTIWSVNRIASTQSPKFNKMHVVALYSELSSNHLLIYFYQIWLIVSESSSLSFIIKYFLPMFTTLISVILLYLLKTKFCLDVILYWVIQHKIFSVWISTSLYMKMIEINW